MVEDIFTLNGEDGKIIYVHRWMPEKGGSLKGILQISHGMAEHGGRYKGFADISGWINSKLNC